MYIYKNNFLISSSSNYFSLFIILEVHFSDYGPPAFTCFVKHKNYVSIRSKQMDAANMNNRS